MNIYREGWDNKLISFRLTSPSQGERDKTTISLRSIVALRVAVFDRNLKTRCIRFALAGFVEPSARVRFLFSVKQKGPPKGTFLFQGERGIRTLGPVTDSGFRDRPIRPLWHLSEVCTI